MAHCVYRSLGEGVMVQRYNGTAAQRCKGKQREYLSKKFLVKLCVFAPLSQKRWLLKITYSMTKPY
jgi:hypothetical protein